MSRQAWRWTFTFLAIIWTPVLVVALIVWWAW